MKQVFFTRKPGALYAISVGWPGSRLVIHHAHVGSGGAVHLLGLPGTLAHEVKGTDLIIHLPVLTGDQIPCQHAYAFKMTGVNLEPDKT